MRIAAVLPLGYGALAFGASLFASIEARSGMGLENLWRPVDFIQNHQPVLVLPEIRLTPSSPIMSSSIGSWAISVYIRLSGSLCRPNLLWFPDVK